MVPDINPDRYDIEEIPEVYVAGDPEQIQANRDFLKTWLVDQDYDTAFKSFAPEWLMKIISFLL